MMVKRRPNRKPQDSATTNNNNNNNNSDRNDHNKHGLNKNCKARRPSSPSSTISSFIYHWTEGSTFLKLAVLICIATLGPIIILNDFGFKGTFLESSIGDSFVEGNGGWSGPDPETVKALGSNLCNIDRVSVRDLDLARFEKEFRYVKPVIVTFPRGASDWTDPEKWSLGYLKRSYGEWEIGSGNSVEIVRKGGNGDMASSFDDFIDSLMRQRTGDDGQPSYYMFDRSFYKDSDLPSTLNLPPYFSTDEELNESIFFLGASGSGVVFHKHADTWNGVVFGQKRWFLYPQTHTPPGGVYPGFSILDWYQHVYPNLTVSQQPIECVQRAGEILYLPEGFYHATINIGDTIAVALQRQDPVLESEILMYEVTQLNKELDETEAEEKALDIHQKLLSNFKELHQLLPENAEIIMKLGEKYGDVGEPHQAVKLLQKAIDLDPYFVFAYTLLGSNLASLGHVEEAEKALMYAVKLSPRMWDVYKEYGMFLLKQGRNRDAVPVLKKGTELNPNLLPFWSYLRVAQERSGDAEGAKITQLKMEELMARDKQ